MTGKKWLWMRTIGSTLIGESVDTTVFCLIAFAGTMSGDNLLALAFSNIIFKVAVEIIFTPLTYWVIRKLKEK